MRATSRDPSDDSPQEQLDYQALFEAAPGLYLVLAPDRPRFTILAVSDAYLQATMTERTGPTGIIGRGLFDAFPDPPRDPEATVRNLRASLHRAVANCTPDVMPIQRYNIRRPDGTWTERYWTPSNTPVMASDGSVRYLIHEVQDVTSLARAQEAERLARHAVETAQNALERAKSQLQREHSLLQAATTESVRLRRDSERLRAEVQTLLAQSASLHSHGKRPHRKK